MGIVVFSSGGGMSIVGELRLGRCGMSIPADVPGQLQVALIDKKSCANDCSWQLG